MLCSSQLHSLNKYTAENTLATEILYNHFTMHYLKYTCADMCIKYTFQILPSFKIGFFAVVVLFPTICKCSLREEHFWIFQRKLLQQYNSAEKSVFKKKKVCYFHSRSRIFIYLFILNRELNKIAPVVSILLFFPLPTKG